MDLGKDCSVVCGSEPVHVFPILFVLVYWRCNYQEDEGCLYLCIEDVIIKRMRVVCTCVLEM